jgi:hypothetical protein
MLKTKTKPRIVIGPEHQGRRMSLKSFEFAEPKEGHIYELSRGFIVVSDVPNFPHAMRVAAVREPLVDYKLHHPGVIYAILGTMECKLLVWELESERHPDLAIYLTPPLQKRGRKIWRGWIPEIVVEVVSESSSDRDYTLKREEYWALGIKEYWIVDGERGQILILRRGRTRWIETALGGDDVHETKLLPDFRLSCQKVLDIASDE